MSTMTKKMDQAKATVLRALEAAAQEPRTPEAARAAADAIVALRRLHTHEGLPDWAGRSPEYRLAIELLYRQAGVTSDSKGGLQANLRYHVGNAVREAAPSDDLLALGMTVDGPAERSRKNRMASRRAAGRPARPREVVDLAQVSPLALLAHAQQDVNLARSTPVPDGDEHEALVAARSLLDLVVEYVGDLARLA